ncbi:hypothetical protein PCANC_04711 [Puccinia coronata f. sp. avenae]|uniref:Ig-like domain-containing protein n=1 Tax=Puccinia coronata f. sp. avenae TaxID=200324 RepID=A0A2N5SXV9_9BASI|nr:hypothetical protein PCANC_14712 [Puccinia coronata f. sp. avenae]PLW43516.1 hypothetical protein PCASD_06755 [Puccinia coronata f. sp. avenae]PLW56123.1 hypothetical protein PCANC_04711 [Puccinia coronata f. sp. avenae]
MKTGWVSGQSYNDQSTTLYVTSPSCASYKCEVTIHHGDTLNVNWLNAPSGDVKLVLASETDSKSYTIKDRIAGTQSDCYHGDNGHRPCGQYNKTIPKDWAYGKYSVQVISLSTPDKIGYTDIVTITKPKNMPRSRPHRAVL